MRPCYQVWVWLDHNEEPVYVGYGNANEGHPAKRLWERREQFRCPLFDWLRDLPVEPKRDRQITSSLLSRSQASAIAEQLRERYKRNGYDLLVVRPEGSYAGGGSGRQVLDPELRVFPSVREAAIAYEVNPSTVTRWCQQREDWDYLGA